MGTRIKSQGNGKIELTRIGAQGVVGLQVSVTAGSWKFLERGRSKNCSHRQPTRRGNSHRSAKYIAVAGADPANDLILELRNAAADTRESKGNKSWTDKARKGAHESGYRERRHRPS
jgi:hypothetical protein